MCGSIRPARPEPPPDLRRLVWGIVRHAPTLAGGGERVGEATANVTPWPHQVRAFERLYRNWPPQLLIADEVGLGKAIEAGLVLRQAWLAGRARRTLILAPKAVLTQWQIELREKFNLGLRENLWVLVVSTTAGAARWRGIWPPTPSDAAPCYTNVMDEHDAMNAMSAKADTESAPIPPATPPSRLSAPADEHRKELLEHRGWLRQVDYQSSAEYDKLLTTLAAGALSISVGFFRDAFGSTWEGYVLLGCWGLFAATLTTALLAYRPTRDMISAEIGRLDAVLRGEPPTKLAEAVDKAKKRARLANRVALWLFIAGMIAQLTFLIARSPSMSEKKNTPPSPATTVRESYDRVPPPPPAPRDPSPHTSYDQLPPPPPPPPKK